MTVAFLCVDGSLGLESFSTSYVTTWTGHLPGELALAHMYVTIQIPHPLGFAWLRATDSDPLARAPEQLRGMLFTWFDTHFLDTIVQGALSVGRLWSLISTFLRYFLGDSRLITCGAQGITGWQCKWWPRSCDHLGCSKFELTSLCSRSLSQNCSFGLIAI